MKKNGFKKNIRNIHLCLGLSSGIIVFIIAVTGCFYAFQEEIQKEGFDYLDAPIRRITSADAPMHYAPNLTSLAIPDVTRTVKLVKEVMYMKK